MRWFRLLAIVGLLLGHVAAAQDATSRRLIAPEEWRAMTEGRTVYYEIDGEYHGREFYAPGGNRVYFQFRDGTCLEGNWEFIDPYYRFLYFFDGAWLEPDDFLHIREGKEVFAEYTGGSRHRVARITREALACTPEVTS